MSRLRWRTFTRQGSQPWSIATIGKGALTLHIFIQDNGEGWHNWCVTRDEDDLLMESPDRIEGGSPTMAEARGAAEKIALDAVVAMAASLGYSLREDH